MGFLARWRIHKKVAQEGNVEVSEKDGVRRLHFGTDTVQSAMRVADPYSLEIAYTRSMMACLLFHTEAQQFLMIGLGGGSTAKWVHQHLPQSITQVVEVNPEVIKIARSYFHVPLDDDRLQVLEGDGAAYIQQCAQRYDVIMVDGYDAHSQVEALSTETFYADCRAALRARGVLVVNLWASDTRFHEYIETMNGVFDGLIVCLPAASGGNIIVFAFERSPGMPKWDDLRLRALALQSLYGLEFPRFVDGLRKLNLHNSQRLLV